MSFLAGSLYEANLALHFLLLNKTIFRRGLRPFLKDFRLRIEYFKNINFICRLLAVARACLRRTIPSLRKILVSQYMYLRIAC